MRKEWTKIYQPKCLKDLILDESIRNLFQKFIDTKSLPCMTLCGPPGIGKTTLATLLVKETNCESDLFIAASADNSVEIVRTKIREFCDSVGFNGSDKIVILDEADRYTSSASVDALRNIIDSCDSDTTFILTCNYINKISQPILSRCNPINIKYGIKDVIIKIVEILKNENIEYTTDDIAIITKNIIQKHFPDIRRIIKNVELCCKNNNKFIYQDVTFEEEIDTVIDYIMTNIDKPKDCREYWIKNESIFNGDYLLLGRYLFNKVQNSSALIPLGERLYQMNVVLDKEIAFYVMVLELHKCLKTV